MHIVNRRRLVAATITATTALVLAPAASAATPDPAAWTVTDQGSVVLDGWGTANHGSTRLQPVPRTSELKTSTASRRANGHRRHSAVRTATRRPAATVYRARQTCRPVHPNQGIWTVGDGDTLTLIARCTGQPIDVLRRWNDIQGDTIRLGDQLAVTRRAAKRLAEQRRHQAEGHRPDRADGMYRR
jgi:LysM repeat protein